MKKILLLITFAFSVIFSAGAQQQTTEKVVVPQTDMQQKVVIDSAGATIPYTRWHQLMADGGYMLRGKGINADTLLLVKLSAGDIERRNRLSASLPVPKLPPSPAFTVGEKKYLYNAKDIYGDKVDFKALQGKVIVLNFWFIACAPCKQEIPELNKLVADNPDVIFVAMGLDQKDEIKGFLKETPFNYRQVYDSRYVSNKYGVHSFPTNVVVDKTGVIRYSSAGYGNGGLTQLKKAIEEAKAAN